MKCCGAAICAARIEGQLKLLNATLENICQGGIFDHLGGGISRYSTDEAWLVPHFEKMLYDNAQFIDLLTLVWPGTHSTLYRLAAV